MKPFNIVSIEPVSYAHNGMLYDVVNYLYWMLQECGFKVTRSVNKFNQDCYNIFFAAHLLNNKSVTDQFPADSIIFNTEQLEPYKLGEMWSKGGVYADLLARCTVWDYSHLNLSAIPHDRKAVIPLLYCEKLRPKIKREPSRTLLFYGSLSPSRQQTLAALRDARIQVTQLFGIYGETRDRHIMNSWAVLNLHRDIPYIENRYQFESVRCFYPLNCGVPVISDISVDSTAEIYRDHILFVNREDMISMVLWLYHKSAQDFADVVDERLDSFKRTTGVAALAIYDAVHKFYD